MPGQSITTRPTAMAGLTDGALYRFQNLTAAEVWIVKANARPGSPDGAEVLFPRGNLLSVRDLRKVANVAIWIWAGREAGGQVVAIEQPAAA